MSPFMNIGLVIVAGVFIIGVVMMYTVPLQRRVRFLERESQERGKQIILLKQMVAIVKERTDDLDGRVDVWAELTGELLESSGSEKAKVVDIQEGTTLPFPSESSRNL